MNRSLCYVVLFDRDNFRVTAFGVFCSTSLLTTMASPAEPRFVSSRLAFFLSPGSVSSHFSISSLFVVLPDVLFPMVVLPSVELSPPVELLTFVVLPPVVVSPVEVVPLE